MTARKLSGALILALAAACGSAEKPGTTSSGTTTAGLGGATGTTTPSSSTTSSTTLAVGGFGGFGGSTAACDPAPDPSSLWAQSAVPYTDPNPTTLCAYRGDVLLIVNTAAI